MTHSHGGRRLRRQRWRQRWRAGARGRHADGNNAAAESGGGGGGGGGKLSTFNIFEYIICLFFFMLLDLAMVL